MRRLRDIDRVQILVASGQAEGVPSNHTDHVAGVVVDDVLVLHRPGAGDVTSVVERQVEVRRVDLRQTIDVGRRG